MSLLVSEKNKDSNEGVLDSFLNEESNIEGKHSYQDGKEAKDAIYLCRLPTILFPLCPLYHLIKTALVIITNNFHITSISTLVPL